MSVSFDIYRIGLNGERVLVHSTQSAHEAREVRDAGPGEMVVVGREGSVDDDNLRTLNDADEHAQQQTSSSVEGA